MSGRDVQMFGILMLVATILALCFNVGLLVVGQGNQVVTATLGITVGVGGFVVGEIWRQA